MNDVQYHYNTGYGNPYSSALGFPWVNATARTLLADDADQDLYVSFTHRELPPTVLVAMGLFNNSGNTGANDVNATMPLRWHNYFRQWKSSAIIPFLANIAIERMACDSYGYEQGVYFRTLVNQSPQQMPTCSDGPGESCKQTTFENYIEGRGQLAGSFTDVCQPEYKNSTDVLSIYESGTGQ